MGVFGDTFQKHLLGVFGDTFQKHLLGVFGDTFQKHLLGVFGDTSQKHLLGVFWTRPRRHLLGVLRDTSQKLPQRDCLKRRNYSKFSIYAFKESLPYNVTPFSSSFISSKDKYFTAISVVSFNSVESSLFNK